MLVIYYNLLFRGLEMTIDVLNEITLLMQKSVIFFKKKIKKFLIGKPSVEIFNSLVVDYYNTKVLLKKISNITIKDFKTIKISIFDVNIINNIKKIIINLNLGLTPYVSGNNILVSFPILTTERKQKIMKLLENELENAKIKIRNIRRDGNEKVKLLNKKKKINIDEEKFYLNKVQILTNNYISIVNKIVDKKKYFIKNS